MNRAKSDRDLSRRITCDRSTSASFTSVFHVHPQYRYEDRCYLPACSHLRDLMCIEKLISAPFALMMQRSDKNEREHVFIPLG